MLFIKNPSSLSPRIAFQSQQAMAATSSPFLLYSNIQYLIVKLLHFPSMEASSSLYLHPTLHRRITINNLFTKATPPEKKQSFDVASGELFMGIAARILKSSNENFSGGNLTARLPSVMKMDSNFELIQRNYTSTEHEFFFFLTRRMVIISTVEDILVVSAASTR